MAESTLSITLDDLRAEVCRFLGFGRFGYAGLSPDIAGDVDAWIRRGLRQFYAPMPLPGETSSHRWSFLAPRGSMSTIAGAFNYDMPEDFQSLEGDLTIVETSRSVPIRTVSEAAFRATQQGSAPIQGMPRIACVFPKQSGLVAGNPDIPLRWAIDLWPTPDANYSIRFRYHTLQDAPTSGSSNLPGGMLHGETIIASCLAIAEAYGHTPATRYRSEFMERLAASVALDRSATAADFLGRNEDRSDCRESVGRHGGDYVVTYEGVSP